MIHNQTIQKNSNYYLNFGNIGFYCIFGFLLIKILKIIFF
jgi:hypothetical protein